MERDILEMTPTADAASAIASGDAVKWTPGPWTIEDDEQLKIKDAGGNNIAHLAHVHLRGRRSRDEVIANARLLVAAPELFVALAIAEDVLSRSPYSSAIWPNGTHPQVGIEQIRSALARARGE